MAERDKDQPITVGFAIALLVGAFALFALIVLASAAMAAHQEVVRGTNHADRIHTGNGNQTIYARGGNDRVGAGRGNDILYGGKGNDVLFTGKGGAKEAAYGGAGNDRLNDWASGQSPGTLVGGRGRDTCIGDKHDIFRSCERIIIKVDEGSH